MKSYLKMIWYSKMPCLLIMLCGVSSLNVTANQEVKSKWRLGLGLGGQNINDYRGSKSTQLRVLPFPIIQYSGKLIKIDRRGARASFFSSAQFEFNLSADLALNGGDEDGGLREGMPELDTAVQFGPSLDINLSGEKIEEGFSLRLPLRGVFAVNSEKIDPIGFNVAPKITHRYTPKPLWQVKSDIGVIYGTRQYHEYFYAVSSEFATSERSEYQVKSGYSGAFIKSSLSYRHDKWFHALSVRYDNIAGAAFDDSPLVETDHYWAITFASARLFDFK